MLARLRPLRPCVLLKTGSLCSHLVRRAGPGALQLALPQSPTDLSWWCRAERSSVFLDASASVLWQLSELCEQAAVERRGAAARKSERVLMREAMVGKDDDLVLDAIRAVRGDVMGWRWRAGEGRLARPAQPPAPQRAQCVCLP